MGRNGQTRAMPTPADREAELVTRAAAGDREAMAELLSGYHDRVYALCLRMVSHREDAADLTQDALTKVILNLRTFRGDSAFSTWVIRIAMNRCLSHLRRRRSAEAAGLTPAGADALEHGSRSVVSRELSARKGVEHDEQRAALLLALNELGDDARALLVLRDVQGLEYERIGEVLGLPLGTVKSRLFRARLSLRRAVEAYEAGQSPQGAEVDALAEPAPMSEQ